MNETPSWAAASSNAPGAPRRDGPPRWRPSAMRGPWTTLWWLLRRLALLAVAATLSDLIVQILMAAASSPIAPLLGASPRALLIAAAVYLAGHGLRVLRLALLIGGWRVGLRDIACFHLMTSATTLATPLKLGEIYRVLELATLAGGLERAVVITWWERVFDAGVLLLILMLTLANATEAAPFIGVAALVAVFLVATAVVFFVFPDNLRRLSVLIIRRYDEPRTVGLLRLLGLVRRSILEAPRMVRGKVTSLMVLTLLIWIANLASFVIALPALRVSWRAGPEALLGFLSALTRGQTLLGALTSADPHLVAVAATQAPLAFIGLAAAFYYAWRRTRQGAGGVWAATTSKG